MYNTVWDAMRFNVRADQVYREKIGKIPRVNLLKRVSHQSQYSDHFNFRFVILFLFFYTYSYVYICDYIYPIPSRNTLFLLLYQVRVLYMCVCVIGTHIPVENRIHLRNYVTTNKAIRKALCFCLLNISHTHCRKI